jgi:hypothetical protein
MLEKPMEKATLATGVVLLTQDQARSRHPNVKIDVGNLGMAQRGDWLRMLIEFPLGDGRADEFLTGMVKEPGNGTVLKCRILSKPEYSTVHGLRYGDDLTVHVMHILEHTKASEDEKIRTAYLLEDMKAIQPTPGKVYWTRNGGVANIWTLLTDTQGAYYLGEVSGVRDVQWKLDGSHRAGDSGLDIVKDPTASELTQG